MAFAVQMSSFIIVRRKQGDIFRCLNYCKSDRPFFSTQGPTDLSLRAGQELNSFTYWYLPPSGKILLKEKEVIHPRFLFRF